MPKHHHLKHLYDKLLTNHELNSNNIIAYIKDSFNDTISKRTAQRYMNELTELYPYISSEKKGNQKTLKLKKEHRSASQFVDSQSNHLLSMYILKAHLSSFKETLVDEGAEGLIKNLERQFPGNVYSEDSLFWNQNNGQFLYSEDEKYIKRINKIIDHIRNEKGAKIKYHPPHRDKASEFETFFRQFFQYSGTLYVASYIPTYKQHIALAVQYIDSIRKLKDKEVNLPKFDFKEFTKDRFGVFHGEIKRVVLEIMPEYRKYFENRIFHQSQKTFREDKKDDVLVIRMDVPISPELVNWILGWGEAIKVRQPNELIDEIKTSAESILGVCK